MGSRPLRASGAESALPGRFGASEDGDRHLPPKRRSEPALALGCAESFLSALWNSAHVVRGCWRFQVVVLVQAAGGISKLLSFSISTHDGYFHDRYRHCILGVLSTDGVSDLVTLVACKTVVKVMLLVNENTFMRAAAVRISEILLARE